MPGSLAKKQRDDQKPGDDEEEVDTQETTSRAGQPRAVIGLTKQFGLDGAPHNIRVNAICPGWIDTPLVDLIKSAEPLLEWTVGGTPMGRLGRPEEIANVALFLAGDESSYVNGTHILADGGWTAK